MYVLRVLPVYICTTCMPSVHGGQKTASDHPELEFYGWLGKTTGELGTNFKFLLPTFN